MSNSSFRRTKPSSNNTNLTNQTTSSHTRTNSSSIHFHFEQTSCNRTSNCRSQSWSNPNLRIFNNIWHLKHTCSKPLGKNTTPTVFLKTQHRKTHHLSTTPSNSSATSKTNKSKSRTNSSRTNWQSQSNTNNNRNQNSHPERMQLSRPNNQITNRTCRSPNIFCSQNS